MPLASHLPRGEDAPADEIHGFRIEAFRFGSLLRKPFLIIPLDVFPPRVSGMLGLSSRQPVVTNQGQQRAVRQRNRCIGKPGTSTLAKHFPFTSPVLAVQRPTHCEVRVRLVHSETYNRVVVEIARCPCDCECVSSCGSTRRRRGHYG